MRFETHSSFVSVPRIVAKNQIWCKTANHGAPPCDVDKIKAHVEECRQSKKLDPVVYIYPFKELLQSFKNISSLSLSNGCQSIY